MLSEFDFCVLRFKIAHLLKIGHRRIKSMDVMLDGKIIVHTFMGLIPISFNSVKEIDNDFAKFYPDVVVPDKFTSTDGLHRTIVKEKKELLVLA